MAPETKALIGRISLSGFWPPKVSRDFAGELPCECTACFLNSGKRCRAPSAVTIAVSGMCEIYRKQMEASI
jgi:hypothetical protein